MRGCNRVNGGLFAIALAASVCPVQGHPHDPLDPTTHAHTSLGLEITIGDDAVTYDVLLSNSYLNRLVPRERGDLKLVLRENRFEFGDPKQAQQEHNAFRAFFEARIAPLEVNGKSIKPVFDSVEFIPSVDPTGVLDHSQSPPDARARIHFDTATPPQTVAITWSLFPPGSTRDVFGDPQPAELAARLDAYTESRIITFTSNETRYVWQAPEGAAGDHVAQVVVAQSRPTFALPLASSCILAGWVMVLTGLYIGGARKKVRHIAIIFTAIPLLAAYWVRGDLVKRVPAPWRHADLTVSEDHATETFTALLRNVYRAFDYKSESDIYDVLAKSVDGEQLNRIYNEVYQSLVAREQGGAVARVKDIEFITTQLASSDVEEGTNNPTFSVRCRWRVYGLVYHWGHVHDRANEYRARYTVAQRDGAWKITDTIVLGQRRLNTVQSPVTSEEGGANIDAAQTSEGNAP